MAPFIMGIKKLTMVSELLSNVAAQNLNRSWTVDYMSWILKQAMTTLIYTFDYSLMMDNVFN